MQRTAPTPETVPSRVRALPTWLLSQAHAHAHRLLLEGFAAAGVRGHHYRLLAALEEFGPASQASLSRRTGIDRSDVVAALDDLAGQRSIERAPDPADRRRNVVTITPAGVERLYALDQVVAGVQEQLLTPLTPTQRTQLVRLLARLTEDDAERRPGPPRGTPAPRATAARAARSAPR